MSKDQYPEEERLRNEISRSLSVVKMKEAHKQIEEIEKSRKRSVVVSINERLSLNMTLNAAILTEFDKLKKNIPENLHNKKLTGEFSPLTSLVKTYESTYFDFQRNIDIKKEDFDRLFPKVKVDLSTFNNIISTMLCVATQMLDMKAYCIRLL